MVEQRAPASAAKPIRVANCSGFYGDRLSAMREMLDGGSLDYVTGDYLAELTMLILGRDRLKDPALGYARTFLTQLEDCLVDALERRVRIVSNAGGLNPMGLAARIAEVARRLGLSARIAYVTGDDVVAHFPDALTANAYLGAAGIASALGQGADVVVTGRVTDASLLVGPAVATYGWQASQYDALAGAVVAGHVIECGAQACGGNFSGFADLPRSRPIGFPIAEVAEDGSSVITKHEGTGGAVTVDTVTAQLLYEIQGPTYLNPDVAVDLTSVRLTQDGPDRVRIHGVRGSEPPQRLKVSVNRLGGHRNSVEFVLTGLDVARKAAWVREQLEALLDPRPALVEWTLDRLPGPDAETEEAASCRLRLTVQDPSAEVVGRQVSSAAVELALASYPGLSLTAPPGRGAPFGVYEAGWVDRADVGEEVGFG
ncbi:acyclic terpene utilization AtuA family protein [Nocardioides mangrovicus]|uniref:acyclic terpene utilization AtuA family protein n=1 Tax=Nocardioides mangrovicus TaxID=2478913 RepID=UPI001E3FC4FE|nr:acyclic terpene utilization AtuA family protein [Nocardioides mangrovicus]